MSDLRDDVREPPGHRPVPGNSGPGGRLQLQRRRRGRLRRRILVGAAAFTVLVLAVAAVQLLSARGDLYAARADLGRGVGTLTAGRADEALEAFDAARTAALRAEDRLANPAVRLVAAIPGAGNTVETASAVASGAALVALAGQELSAAAITLPEGIAALAPQNGRIPVDAIGSVAPALDRAHETVSRAHELVAASPEALLPGSVGDARAELLAQLRTVDPQLEVAAALAEALPAFLGQDGPRRYFFGAQNPAEIRGTGGFIGAFSVLTVDDGRLGFESFRSIIDLSPLPVGGVEPPSAEYHRLYGWAGGAGFGQNANMTADVPSAAIALQRLYERIEGRELDGAILVDPNAFAALLDVAGSVEIDGVGEVTAETVVAQIANEAYAVLPDAERKELLGDVAAATLDRFLSSGAADNPRRAAEALVGAAGGGHVRLYADDPEVMAAFDVAGVTGRLDAPHDLIAVAANNAAQNKVDFYTERHVTHEVWLEPNGNAEAETTVRLANDAPTTGMPLDVIGPNVPYLEAGENRTLVSVYCGKGCVREGSWRGEEEVDPVLRGTELGFTLVATREQYASGEEAVVTHRFRIPDAWDTSTRTYDLRVLDQPTIRPTTVQVRIHAPEGMLVRDASSGVAVADATATWSGKLDGQRDLRVRFGPPGRSVWRQFTDWLGSPAFRAG